MNLGGKFLLAVWLLVAALLFAVTRAEAGSRDVVRFSSVEGELDIELYRNEAPLTVENFLKYVDRGNYNNSIIHRSVPGFVIQGGGFGLNGTTLVTIADNPPVRNEPGISNLRGTVAMAKLGGDPNSATSQWFVNLGNNSAILDGQNGGFTVFGHVVGNGMRIVDRIASFTVYNATAQLGGTFGELPLKGPSLAKENLVLFSKVRALRAGTIVQEFDFSQGDEGFSAGFADLPTDFDPALYQLLADHRALPSELGSGKGLFLSGANRSDDLWMYWKKKITGLEPNASYEISMDLDLGSSESAGAVGIGGPPAESVFVKVGASAVEPVAVADSDGWFRMNINKGNQSTSGRAAKMIGDISKESNAGDGYARIFRNNRSVRLSARSAADGSLWLFFGTDSGYEGTTSIYYNRFAVVMELQDMASVLQAAQGAFIGNYAAEPMLGQISVRLTKGGAFTGSITRASGQSVFRGKFNQSGTATALIPTLGSLRLSLHSAGLDDGRWDNQDSVYLTGILETEGQEIAIECRPASHRGGSAVSLAGSRINTLLECLGKSGVEFGHGFAGVAVGRDGAVRFTGSLADGTKLSGSARMVEDGEGGWKLPVALPLAAVKGFLHGEAAVASEPGAGEFHLESTAPWSWIRPANPNAKSFAAGFQEELDVKGRVWSWTKGTSALGGAGGNFTLESSFGDNSGVFVPAAGLGNLQGRLGADNKPVWSAGSPPKGFSMIITPATGLFSGKIPGTQKGKPAAISYQGVLFPADMPIGSAGSVRGAGFFADSTSSNRIVFAVP